MTHDVLQSDIDLARRLVDAGRPVNEIVAALAHRGVDSNRATQLVADLQSGKTVEPDKPISINLPSKTTEEISAAGRQHSRERIPTDMPAGKRRSARAVRKANAFPWFSVIALTSAAVCVAAFVLLSRKSHNAGSTARSPSQTIDKSSAPFVGSNQPASGLPLEPKAISVEVGTEGLKLCGAQVSRENFLAGIFKIIGTASRTNQIEKGDQVIYAYDAYGLVIYSPRDSGHHLIVLDFDASDGAAGTKNPFVGPFKIRNQLIRPATDANSLGLIKDLELQAPTSASGIFRARYAGLELVFGYLKSPERLSLVEIDFK